MEAALASRARFYAVGGVATAVLAYGAYRWWRARPKPMPSIYSNEALGVYVTLPDRYSFESAQDEEAPHIVFGRDDVAMSPAITLGIIPITVTATYVACTTEDAAAEAAMDDYLAEAGKAMRVVAPTVVKFGRIPIEDSSRGLFTHEVEFTVNHVIVGNLRAVFRCFVQGGFVVFVQAEFDLLMMAAPVLEHGQRALAHFTEALQFTAVPFRSSTESSSFAVVTASEPVEWRETTAHSIRPSPSGSEISVVGGLDTRRDMPDEGVVAEFRTVISVSKCPFGLGEQPTVPPSNAYLFLLRSAVARPLHRGVISEHVFLPGFFFTYTPFPDDENAPACCVSTFAFESHQAMVEGIDSNPVLTHVTHMSSRGGIWKASDASDPESWVVCTSAENASVVFCGRPKGAPAEFTAYVVCSWCHKAQASKPTPKDPLETYDDKYTNEIKRFAASIAWSGENLPPL